MHCFPAWIRTTIFPTKGRGVLPEHHGKIEVRTGFEPVKSGFADRSLTTRAPDLKAVEITGLEPVTNTV